ncbi:hypothetical protein [Pseudoalteromonas rubra]|uniref:Uncharacterized protein n=1 Tax=Pseudoalteromonas rubra TaxID=43658 RepID=A0A0F4QUT4_9GAMM|nr:hypothetical protein [Pseudoalteromonas rubra]KJZ11428.1 hypothetical protein TW77_05995 [Pseudoalteromonas rubra]
MNEQLFKDIGILTFLATQVRNSLNQTLMNNICTAAKTQQFHLIKNDYGEAVGYVLFAHIDYETLQLLQLNGPYPLQPYEWREGYITWIVDVCILPQWRKSCWPGLRQLLKGVNKYAYVKKGVGSVVLKKTKKR